MTAVAAVVTFVIVVVVLFAAGRVMAERLAEQREAEWTPKDGES